MGGAFFEAKFLHSFIMEDGATPAAKEGRRRGAEGERAGRQGEFVKLDEEGDLPRPRPPAPPPPRRPPVPARQSDAGTPNGGASVISSATEVGRGRGREREGE